MARDEALIAELLTGGRGWFDQMVAAIDRKPSVLGMRPFAPEWLTLPGDMSGIWEEGFIGSGGDGHGIHNEAVDFLSAALGYDVRVPPGGDWRDTIIATYGADRGIVSAATHWKCASEGGTYDARTGRCTPAGQPPVEPPVEPPTEPPVEPPEPEPVDPYVLRLQGGRFEVGAAFERDETSIPETGTAVPLPQFGDAGGAFWFFSPDNPELFVKVVGPVAGKFWVFAAALSDVAFTLVVVDTKTGAERFYKNNAGEFSGLARDTEAFEA